MIKNIFLIKFSELHPIGKFKYAPGTIASIFTCIIFFYLNTYFQIEIIILTFFIVFIISLLSIQNYLQLYGNKDHQSIVIDEFLGQYIALFSIPLFELENNIYQSEKENHLGMMINHCSNFNEKFKFL